MEGASEKDFQLYLSQNVPAEISSAIQPIGTEVHSCVTPECLRNSQGRVGPDLIQSYHMSRSSPGFIF